MSALHVSSAFDGGNAELEQAQGNRLLLRIREDFHSEHRQWFYFRVTGGRGQDLELRLTNAAQASYPYAWDGYQAVASYDQQDWFRVPTRYEDGQLVIEHHAEHDAVFYAYFAPYPLERHYRMLARYQVQPGVRLETVGRTLDGRSLDVLTVGATGAGSGSSGASSASSKPPKKVWIWARQHPGETMAEWFMDGLIGRLLDPQDAVALWLRQRTEFHLVPNMNPDGSFRGHLRCNAAGVNLNREWLAPSAERSPEVLAIRSRMEDVGVDFGLDVHGDEELPYNFIAGIGGIPSLTQRQRDLQSRYEESLLAASGDFQVEHGYPKAAPGKANLSLAAPWVAEHFGCLALTLEMPFKDNANRPVPRVGWSPSRCAQFGREQLLALTAVVEAL